MNTPADAASEDTSQAVHPTQPEDTTQPIPPAPAKPSAPIPAKPSAPLLPAQSREDTDVGWGDYADRDDDDRLLRDRPPHWGNG